MFRSDTMLTEISPELVERNLLLPISPEPLVERIERAALAGEDVARRSCSR